MTVIPPITNHSYTFRTIHARKRVLVGWNLLIGEWSWIELLLSDVQYRDRFLAVQDLAPAHVYHHVLCFGPLAHHHVMTEEESVSLLQKHSWCLSHCTVVRDDIKSYWGRCDQQHLNAAVRPMLLKTVVLLSSIIWFEVKNAEHHLMNDYRNYEQHNSAIIMNFFRHYNYVLTFHSHTISHSSVVNNKPSVSPL